MTEQQAPSEVTIEERVQALEEDLGQVRETNAVQNLVISQYEQALANANRQNAFLRAQLKLTQKPTA